MILLEIVMYNYTIQFVYIFWKKMEGMEIGANPETPYANIIYVWHERT